MKPIIEKINLNQDSSIRVLVLDQDSSCSTLSWHLHPEYELVYVKNGQGTVNVSDYCQPYEDGLLIFLGPNIPHSSFGNSDHNDGMEVVIQFSEAFVNNKIKIFPEFSDMMDLIYQSRNGLLFSDHIKNEVATHFEDISKLKPAELLTRVFQLLYVLSQEKSHIDLLKHPSLNSQKDRSRISNTFDYVNQYYSDDISSNTMAEYLGLTTNSFCKIFRRGTGKSFLQFLNEFRIQKATGFLNEGDFTISEVMYQCGFKDPSYFSKQFKKVTKVSPTEYLRRRKTRSNGQAIQNRTIGEPQISST